MCVCEIHTVVCISQPFFLFCSQHNSTHEGSETSEQEEAQRQMQRGTFGIFSSTDCTAALPQTHTADNAQDCCCLPQGEPAHSHSALCAAIPPQSREAAANPRFLSVHCMLVNAVLDFPFQGATCKAETPNLPRDSHTWMPGFLLQGRDCPSSQTLAKHH